MKQSVGRVIALFLCVGYCHLARVPKIYNALISSDESLQPSRAFPILEPVLVRTTNLGISSQIPPLVVRPTQAQDAQLEGEKNGQLLTTYTGSLYPVTYDPYLIYGYHRDFLYPSMQPLYHHPLFLDYNRYQETENNEAHKLQGESPRKTLANLNSKSPAENSRREHEPSNDKQ